MKTTIERLRGKYAHARKGKSKNIRFEMDFISDLIKEIDELETQLMEKPSVVEKIIHAPPIIIQAEGKDGGSF